MHYAQRHPVPPAGVLTLPPFLRTDFPTRTATVQKTPTADQDALVEGDEDVVHHAVQRASEIMVILSVFSLHNETPSRLLARLLAAQIWCDKGLLSLFRGTRGLKARIREFSLV